jgi:hypothetical protein
MVFFMGRSFWGFAVSIETDIGTATAQGKRSHAALNVGRKVETIPETIRQPG